MCSNAPVYYASLDAAALGGPALQSALHTLISPHTVVSYADAWDALADLDAYGAGRVLGVYSDLTHDAPTGDEGPAAARRGDSAPTPSGGMDSQTVLDATIVGRRPF